MTDSLAFSWHDDAMTRDTERMCWNCHLLLSLDLPRYMRRNKLSLRFQNGAKVLKAYLTRHQWRCNYLKVCLKRQKWTELNWNSGTIGLFQFTSFLSFLTHLKVHCCSIRMRVSFV